MSSSRQLRIVFAVHCGAGHVNGSLSLARRLRDRGHRVTYLGLAPARPLVERNGFEFVPFAADILSETAYQPAAAPAAPWWRRRLAAERLFRSFLARCSNGDLDQLLQSCRPDLVICDTLIWYIGLRSLSLGIPTVSLSASLHGPPNDRVPPGLSPRIPRTSGWGRIQVRLDWLRLRWHFFFTKTLASHLAGEFRHPTRMHFLTGEFKRLARRSGIDCRENHTYWIGITGPHLMLPEIMLCPRSFEFPQALVRDRRYVGGKVDIGRVEDTSLLERLDPKKPLVYCSLGSDARFYPHSGHFFRTVVAAARLRSDWQWVLSVGSQQEADRYPETGSKLLVTAWAPQIAILQRAAAMVTHGGLNSILECVHFGVPMVVVPGLRDQPGNMARAVYHGIAAGAPMKDLKPDHLVHLIDRTMHSPEIRRALLLMRDAIAAENGLDAAIDLVESSASQVCETTA